MECHRTYEGISMSTGCRKTWLYEQIIHQCLDLPHIICTLPPEFFFVEVILVDTNKIIKGPDIYFGKFLRIIGIWMLMKSSPGINRWDYFSETL